MTACIALLPQYDKDNIFKTRKYNMGEIKWFGEKLRVHGREL